MFIERLNLENFRIFTGEHEIHLHPRLTVFSGINGTGKSTILDAIGSLLSCVVSMLAGGKKSWFEGGNIANISHSESYSIWRILFKNKHTKSSEIFLHAKNNKDQKLMTPFSEIEIENKKSIIIDNDNYPLLSYIHSSSTVAPVRHKEKVTLDNRLLAYKGAFDSESNQIHDLESWFEQEENLENQEKINTSNLSYQRPSLQAVRKALSNFLSEMRDMQLQGVRMLRQPSNGELTVLRGRMIIGKGANQLFLDQLSAGERRLIFIVLDMARRMVILNPHMKDPTQASGVLAIDEIDLHIHPKWQKNIISALQAAFPELQLLLSTHAPLVLASVPNESVVFIDNGSVISGNQPTYGRSPDAVIEGPMATGLRPEKVQKNLDKLFEAIDTKPRSAKILLRKLEKELGADEPMLIRARTLLSLLDG